MGKRSQGSGNPLSCHGQGLSDRLDYEMPEGNSGQVPVQRTYPSSPTADAFPQQANQGWLSVNIKPDLLLASRLSVTLGMKWEHWFPSGSQQSQTT